MCGIVGFTISGRNASNDHQAMLSGMLRQITHRGPDQDGFRVLDSVAFGHNRLTIMEPKGGRQPRFNDHNTLIYNGEVYNHRAFDAEIQAAGGQLRDHCDTETLFWLIEIYGIEKAVSLIDGMFAFAYYQAEKDTLYLARDAFGQKPLFYAATDGELIFASEIKSLCQHPSLANATPDIDALSLYLMMEYVPRPATGISGIYELPPGHILKFNEGQLRVEPFWSVSDFDREAAVDEEQAAKRLDQLLNRAVEQQLVADVPVGVFLSGGLDSSLIAAIAKQKHSDVSTFTIKFPQSTFDESGYARQVANKIGTRHTTIELDRQNCVDGIAELLEKADQPFADSSMLPTYLLCKATRQHVTVALGGDGADELFAGYPNFKLLRFAGLLASLQAGLGGALRRLLERLPQGNGYMNWAFLLRQLSYGFGKPANTQSIYWMSAVTPSEQQGLWLDGRDREANIAEQIAAQTGDSSGLSLAEQCQQHFLRNYLSQDILQKIDRASMYNSLEVRSPFLSSQVAEYALTLPTTALFRGLTGKRILRRVAGSYLASETISRKKHGFSLPVSTLIKGDLRDIVEATLINRINPMYEYVNFESVDAYWEQHTSGQRDLGKSLWALFMLAAYFKKQF